MASRCSTIYCTVPVSQSQDNTCNVVLNVICTLAVGELEWVLPCAFWLITSQQMSNRINE